MSGHADRNGGPARQPAGPDDRFPGFDAISQAPHWDQVTADVVLARMGPPPVLKFFTAAEEASATALVDQITGQHEEPLVPVLQMIDSRLAAAETDGWRYADMPEDGQAWRDTLAHLDADAHQRCGTPFADAAQTDQLALIQAVQDLKSADWHRLPAARVWSLWTRYACTAFYAHPFAWAEIGFPGPAYPRGYKNAGVGKLERFEVTDAHPSEDPVREGA
jgi:hypothetical protein